MCGKNSVDTPGFTLVELLVVMVIIGIMAAFVVPNLQQLFRVSGRQQFARGFEQLTTVAWEHAVRTQKAHRIWFDLPGRQMRIEIETDKKDATGGLLFEPVGLGYMHTRIIWPSTIVLKQVWVEGDEKLASQRGVNAIWFYIVPLGLSQDVIINFVDTGRLDANGMPTKGSLLLNPFTVQTSSYDTFQKP